MDMKELYKAVDVPTEKTILEEKIKNINKTLNTFRDDLILKNTSIQSLSEVLQQLQNIVLKVTYDKIQWKALKSGVKLPTKRSEDAGFDIYTTDDETILKPGETKLFGTSLISSFSNFFWAEIKERGSTGAVGLSVRSGVIDSGYRGEWKIMLTNVNNYPVEFSRSVDKVTYVYGKIFKKKIKKVIYPLSKAIAQAVLIPLPEISSVWNNDLNDKDSERGTSGWGASGK